MLNDSNGSRLVFVIEAGVFIDFCTIELFSTYPTSRIFVPSNRNTLVDILLGRNVAEILPRRVERVVSRVRLSKK